MKTSILIMLMTISTFLFGQKKPSEYFPDPKTKVLVVGSFHFDYPNQDAHKTEKNDQVDVLKPKTAAEVTELVNYIKKFKPTKIAIEAWPDWKANEKLKEYKDGKYRDQRDERYQLAMRIATELKINELYSIDANSVLDDFTEKFGKRDSVYFKNMLKDYDFLSDDRISKQYNTFIKNTERKNFKSLLDMFKYMNSKEYHQYEYGAYLTGDFKLREHDGADLLALYWYNRNLRMFRKIQDIPKNAEDRILVIAGNGHATVLRQLFTSSPEYEYVEFSNLDSKK
ncbi:DUF5694 domain-containing protein [Chryseobacterium indoltheticum]|uniref:TraB/GumN family protein n=1 Tax=Chryseobacterium indoltheticum TaxID=254 RepID=A0A381F5N4_9FLAO|nr:DUF5694 domain-containing protein [Chryseobacterium indoltheticum]AZA72305.1 hypothetical protein EG358_00365 [Chryseobacterium indoltheticum]SIR09979.1 hypothetical protein SAMN05421682_112101 [Chryseobacterium indoltheticum]SUX41866.1 Uncharacterised protein [Chryseobacterium indoltheticum]